MSFTKDIPNTGQKLGNTRDPIRNNFTAINNNIGVDHFNMTSDAFGGRHKLIRLPRALGQSPGTGSNEYALYTKTVNAQNEIFGQAQAQIPNGPDYQLTSPFLANNTGQNGVGSYTSYSFLPGGFLRIFGYATNAGQLSVLNLGTTINDILSISFSSDSANGGQIPLVVSTINVTSPPDRDWETES